MGQAWTVQITWTVINRTGSKFHFFRGHNAEKHVAKTGFVRSGSFSAVFGFYHIQIKAVSCIVYLFVNLKDQKKMFFTPALFESRMLDGYFCFWLWIDMNCEIFDI